MTTLRDRHVDIGKGTDKSQVKFHFVGKSGVKHNIEIDDPQLAKVIKRCRDIPGYELFQYFDEDDNRQTVDSGDVNDYLKCVTGEDFTAKDFRTWAGTTVATDTLNQFGDWAEEAEAKKNVVAAIKAAAAQLGNRPATCRKYYVHPIVPENYLAGQLIAQLSEAQKEVLANPDKWLDDAEKTVLTILKSI